MPNISNKIFCFVLFCAVFVSVLFCFVFVPYSRCKSANATAWMLNYLGISSSRLTCQLSLISVSFTVSGHGQNVDNFLSKSNTHSHCSTENWDPQLQSEPGFYCLHFYQHSASEIWPDFPIKLTLQYFSSSLVNSSKFYQDPPMNQF